MADFSASQAGAWGEGGGEYSRHYQPGPDGSIDWEAGARGAAGAGAAAVCTAYGAAAAAPVCAAIGSEIAGALITGAKALGASGTSPEELAAMAAADNFQLAMWQQQAALTPLLWRILQDLHAFAQDIGRPQPYPIILALLVGEMRKRAPDALTVWKITSEHAENVGTCPPRGNGPAPLPSECGPPIGRWVEYSGRPYGTSATPTRIDSPMGRRFDRSIEGSAPDTLHGVPAQRTPAPPDVAPGLDQFMPRSYPPGMSAPDGISWLHQRAVSGMEAWARNLAEAAVSTAGLLERSQGSPLAKPGKSTIKNRQLVPGLVVQNLGSGLALPVSFAMATVGTPPKAPQDRQRGAVALGLAGAALGGLAGHRWAARRQRTATTAAGTVAGAALGGFLGWALG